MKKNKKEEDEKKKLTKMKKEVSKDTKDDETSLPAKHA